jgi:hypothetical protein
MTMSRFTYIIYAMVLASMISCGAEDEYANIPCYFVFDNAVHQDAVLASALNSLAPGTFCYITETKNNGAKYITFQSNQGQTSSQLENAVDQRRSITLGVNNGIIVGYGNLTGVLYAYDHQCPNCADLNSAYTPNRPLTMTGDGKAACAKCGRKYDMNNDGVVVSGESGKKLIKYRHVYSSAPLGVLSVGN